MKKYLGIIWVFLLQFWASCNTPKVVKPITNLEEIPTKNIGTMQVLEGKFVEIPFTNKVGRVFPEITDWYFEIGNKKLFIKTIAKKAMGVDLNKIKGKVVKIKGKIENGLWDTDDPEVQSRIGEYLIVYEIL